MMYYLGSHCWLWGGGGLRGTPVGSAPCGSSTRGGAEGDDIPPGGWAPHAHLLTSLRKSQMHNELCLVLVG